MAISEIKELMSNRPTGITFSEAIGIDMFRSIEPSNDKTTWFVWGFDEEGEMALQLEDLNTEQAIEVVKALRDECRPQPKVIVITVEWGEDESMFDVKLPTTVRLPFIDLGDEDEMPYRIEAVLKTWFGCDWEKYSWEIEDPSKADGNTDGSFVISRVHRDDLEAIGFDTSEVDDDTMDELADRMGDDYGNQLFWESLESIAETMEIPRRDGCEGEDE